MSRSGITTKERILDVAMQLVFENGYGGMTVDQIIAGAGITKGAFFHHFKTKNDLAQALLERYIQMDDDLLHDLMGRAEQLSRDSLQQYLIFVGLLEETLRKLNGAPPGCLIASYIYQLELFSPQTQQAVISGFKEWEQVLVAKLVAAMDKHKPKLAVTAEQLYDNLIALFEGGVILSKVYRKAATLADQVAQHKNYVELLFGQRE